MIGKGKWRHAATAVALTAVAALAAGCSASARVRRRASHRRQPAHELRPGRADHAQRRRGAGHGLGRVLRRAERGPVHPGGPEDQLLARDELRDRDPAAGEEASSQITAGNYVSYVEYNADPTHSISVERSISGARSRNRARRRLRHARALTSRPLSELKGKLVGVNAKLNIDYLLDVSVLKENGIDPQGREVPHRQGRRVRSVTRTTGPFRSPSWPSGPPRQGECRRPRCPSRSPASPNRNTARSRWPT